MISLWTKDDTLSLCDVEVMADVFNCFFMETVRIVGKLCALVDCNGYVWSGVCSDKIQFTDDRAIMPVFLAWGAIGVWVQNRCGWHKLVLNRPIIRR